MSRWVMDNPWRRYGLSLLAMLVMVMSSAVAAQGLGVSRLEEPRAASKSVISGARDLAFQPMPGQEIASPGREPVWWRITAQADFDAAASPQLVVSQPARKHIEVWRPGDEVPQRRSMYGADADMTHSTRFHVVPLPHGLQKGESIYIRARSTDVTSSRITIEPASEVLAQDMAHMYLRSFVLSALSLIALLAFGFWVGFGERGYAYLGLTLIAQTLSVAFAGGEMRWLAWLAPLADDRRTYIILNTAAVLASLRFLVFYLGLQRHQPRIARPINGCSALLGGLLALSFYDVWAISAIFGNVVLLVSIGLVAAAIVAAIRLRQREARFLLLAWSPLMAVLVVLVGAYQQWWPAYDWLEFAYPSGLAFGGLGLLLGLTNKVQQLRQDRDIAHRQATYDRLTGAMTRIALEEALRTAVQKCDRAGTPLSIVFFDIDHFKRINDQHGHHVGDEALRAVAQRVSSRLRGQDLYGRFGGDEMVVGLLGADLPQAVVIAEQLRQRVASSPMFIDGAELTVNLSLGVAQMQPGESIDVLLKRADAALYASKSAGRGRVTGYHAGLVPMPET